jgi:hypothetical protein
MCLKVMLVAGNRPIETALILSMMLIGFLAQDVRAQTITLTIEDDNKKTVDAELWKLDVSNIRKRLGVSANGVFVLNNPGSKGERIEILPGDAFVKRKLECPMATQIVTVTRKLFIDNLVANANALKNHSPATAALIYSELSERLADSNVALAKEAKIQTFEQVAVALDVPSHLALDKSGGTVAPSTALQNALINFQENNQIKQTGSTDYRTLSTMSKKDISEFLFHQPDKNSN